MKDKHPGAHAYFFIKCSFSKKPLENLDRSGNPDLNKNWNKVEPARF